MSTTIAVFRPGSRPRPRQTESTDSQEPPAWLPIGRHDLLAHLHGLTLPQRGVWATLCAEAISAGSATLPMSHCQKVAGSHWCAMSTILVRTSRIVIERDEVHIVWVRTAISQATTRIAKGKSMRSGHQKKENSS